MGLACAGAFAAAATRQRGVPSARVHGVVCEVRVTLTRHPTRDYRATELLLCPLSACAERGAGNTEIRVEIFRCLTHAPSRKETKTWTHHTQASNATSLKPSAFEFEPNSPNSRCRSECRIGSSRIETYLI